MEKIEAEKTDIATIIFKGKDLTSKLLYFVNGVEVSSTQISQMNADDVAGLQILGAEQATKAYGKKREYGAVYITTKAAEESKDKDVFDVCEVMPEYPGGMEDMLQYLSTSIRYPKVAFDNGVAARVIVQFIVEKDGSISNVKTIVLYQYPSDCSNTL